MYVVERYVTQYDTINARNTLCLWLQNGDHAYDIPEQYATHNKCTRYCSLPGRNNVANVPKRSLCTDCNEREHLKLSELSDFEPRNERHYDAELKAFEEYLEKKYPLCGGCKSTVRDVLSKQALWLTRYKMLFFKQKPVKAVINVSTDSREKYTSKTQVHTIKIYHRYMVRDIRIALIF